MHESALTPPLPPNLQCALELELDPRETLQWAGQPRASHVVRQSLAVALFGAPLFTAMGGICLWLAYNTWQELRGIKPWTAPNSPSVGAIAAFAIMGALILAFGIWFLLEPSRARGRARRTVFALTDTPVVILMLRHAGHALVDSLEPGHPLRIRRRDQSDGAGEIAFYPPPQRSPSNFALVGVPNPRHVERLIRQTIDPPTIAASSGLNA